MKIITQVKNTFTLMSNRSNNENENTADHDSGGSFDSAIDSDENLQLAGIQINESLYFSVAGAN